MDAEDGLSALTEWKQLSNVIVLSADEASDKYNINTLASERRIAGAILPSQSDDIKKIVLIAYQYRVPLYPFSCGHNWGYGGPTPVSQGCFILDLSQLNKIISFDDELGLVTVEPGVTQGQLDHYLIQRQLPFMAPVTGAGPNVSLLGNVLEHGFGVNPISDHGASLMSLQAVLPDGSIYRKAFSEEANQCIAQAYKWDIGPYLDGLFFQSNFGVVTQMTIALAPKYKNVCSFFVGIESDQHLVSLISRLREILQSIGGIMGPIKMSNVHRLIAIKKLFPHYESTTTLSTDSILEKKLNRRHIPKWIIMSAIYSEGNVIKAAKSVIKKKLKDGEGGITFFTTSQLNKLKRIYEILKFNKKMRGLLNSIDQIQKIMDGFVGHPQEENLIVPYLTLANMSSFKSPLNPDQNNCGLIWFTPLVPMKSLDVETYLAIAKKILLEYKMENAMTMTSLSNYCFDGTVAILFDKTKQSEIDKAHACYRALFAACKEKGYLPYRLPIDYMDLIVNEDSPHWQFVKILKNAIDQHHIISPGRYGL